MDSTPTIVKTTKITKHQYLAGIINSIKKKYPQFRQDSKGVTFALQYAGTPHTLKTNSGFSQEEANNIYSRYHKLYQVSAQYASKKKELAAKQGYLPVAFGLQVRTPLLQQVLWNSSSMPYEAAAEGRTLGNALSQSYGLLNNRAAVAFWEAVWKSKYRLDILPVALIHDAVYALVRDDINVVEFANNELIKAMQWQELPEIQHPTVKLGAALDIYWPSWKYPITLPNNASQADIRKLCDAAKASHLT